MAVNDMKTATRSAAPIRSIDRALLILLETSRQPDGITAAELSTRTGLPLSTVYRLVDALRSRQFLRESLQQGRFLIGSAAFQVGSAYSGQRLLLEAADPVMNKLAHDLNETVNLAAFRQGRAVYLHQVESPTRLMRMFMATGGPVPLHCSGVGKVLLAGLDPAARASRLASLDFEAHTPATITEPAELAVELERTDQLGYALDNEEREPGVRCIAVPVRSSTGSVIAALSAAGPSSRITSSRIPELAAQLSAAAGEITEALRS